MKNGLYDRAISDFNRAIEIDPKHADAYNNRGNAYYNKDKREKGKAFTGENYGSELPR